MSTCMYAIQTMCVLYDIIMYEVGHDEGPVLRVKHYVVTPEMYCLLLISPRQPESRSKISSTQQSGKIERSRLLDTNMIAMPSPTSDGGSNLDPGRTAS